MIRTLPVQNEPGPFDGSSDAGIRWAIFVRRHEMSDLVASLKSVAEDPLVTALALLVLGVIATRLLLRNHPAYRNITRGVFFLLVTIALLHGH
jgi:hypothetical protein